MSIVFTFPDNSKVTADTALFKEWSEIISNFDEEIDEFPVTIDGITGSDEFKEFVAFLVKWDSYHTETKMNKQFKATDSTAEYGNDRPEVYKFVETSFPMFDKKNDLLQPKVRTILHFVVFSSFFKIEILEEILAYAIAQATTYFKEEKKSTYVEYLRYFGKNLGIYVPSLTFHEGKTVDDLTAEEIETLRKMDPSWETNEEILAEAKAFFYEKKRIEKAEQMIKVFENFDRSKLNQEQLTLIESKGFMDMTAEELKVLQAALPPGTISEPHLNPNYTYNSSSEEEEEEEEEEEDED